jgi:hypothetical protein
MSDKPLDVGREIEKKGSIMWSGPGCQTCLAILDLEGKFSLTTERPVEATLQLKKVGDHYLLTIKER